MNKFFKEIGKDNKIHADSHCTLNLIQKCATGIFFSPIMFLSAMFLYKIFHSSKSSEQRTPREHVIFLLCGVVRISEIKNMQIYMCLLLKKC